MIITGVLNTDDWRKWYHTWLDRLTRGALTGWLANSEACKRSLVQREKHPAELIKVMYDGIDVNYWQKGEDPTTRERIRKEFGCGSENIMCVTVANLREQKGHTYLMEAATEVLKANPQMRFVLIGADFLDGAIQAHCKNLGIEHAVIFEGHRKDIRDIYEAADITVMPSLWEGLPISLTESMSMEQPVVSTTVSGIPELVVDGVTGLLVEPRDVEALVKALLEMGGDDKKRKAMGQAGRQRVCEKFTIERMIKEKLEYYQTRLELAGK